VQGAFFCFYIAFSVVALMNVATSVFVEAMSHSMSVEKDDRSEMELRKIFKHLDTCKRGTLRTDDLKRLSSKRFKEDLSKMDIDPREAGSLFELMDMDHSGGVDRKEFTQGCKRLRSPAKAIDIFHLLRKVQEVLERVGRLEDNMTHVGGPDAPSQLG